MITKPLPGRLLNTGHPLSQGLIGCYLFNERSGALARDLSGKTGPGTLTNMDLTGATSNWSGSNDGGGIKFDGSNDYVECANSYAAMTTTSPFTYCAWYMATTVYKILIARKATTNQWFPVLYTTSMNCGKASVTEEGAGSFTGKVGEWYFNCGTYDGTTMSFYVNGVLNGTLVPGATSLSATSNTSGLHTIGTRFLNGTQQTSFDSIVSHALIYNRALSSGEVALLNQDPYIYMNKKSIGLSLYAPFVMSALYDPFGTFGMYGI